MAGSIDQSPAMSEDFRKQVRPLIDLIDRLRFFGLENEVNLPSIVVVGDQSSGKSSVLEALSGVQLPRGSGIVTRCPLELRMKSSSSEGWRGRISYRPQGRDFDNDEDDFGVDEEIDDPDEVEARVRTAQNLLAGPQRGISSQLISLEITAPGVPDLTLIDLPGITRLVVSGQDNGTSQQIRDLIQNFIKKESTVILAVVPANVDIETSEALQLAKEVDREGKRTLGVITKPDLVDRGAEMEMVEVVSNMRYHLRRGYTVVKCRGQAAINSSMTLREALRDEEEFFKKQPHLGSLPDSLMGMKNLSRKLTSVLVEHIKESIPVLKAEIREKLEKVNRELLRIGDGLPTERGQLMLVLTKALQTLTETIGKIEEGNTRLGDENIHELNPYRQARTAFGKFAEEVNAKIPRGEDRRFKAKIKERIQLTRGRELPRFISYQACEELVKEIISTFVPPAKICLVEVNDVIFQILNEVAKRTVGQYRDLEREVKDRIHAMQLKSREACEAEIDKIFKQENLVYTQDRTYSATYDSVLEIKHTDDMQALPRRAPVIPKAVRAMTLFNENYSPEEHLNDEAEHTYEMIMSYMNVCGKRLCDTIPMVILFNMVKNLCETIRVQIWDLLTEDPTRLLMEDDQLVASRQSLRKKAERLQAAQRELSQF